MRRVLFVGWLLIVGLACSAPPNPVGEAKSTAPAVDWAIAIHGGAGVDPTTLPPERVEGGLEGIRIALSQGSRLLDQGASGLDVVEAVLRILEDDPRFNAGRGAVFNHEGGHELDASIMDGSNLGCGAVAGVRTVKNPISLARRVMERTPHVLLGGDGAERFADEQGVERVEPAYFDTPERREALERALAREKEAGGSTVGAVVLDRRGNLAAGTSTGGLTNKMFGRIGDSPIVGAGTYADNRSCAVSATGVGEEFIRHGVARSIAALMSFGGRSLQQAADEVIHGTLRPDDGGVIAVSSAGEIALVFNTQGMYRGAADSAGRFEVAAGH